MAVVVVDRRGIPPRGERTVPMVPPGGAVGEEEEIEKAWPLGGATVVMVAMVTEIKSSNSLVFFLLLDKNEYSTPHCCKNLIV